VQLGARDELIVIDDASQDGSVSVLRSIGDPRLQVHRNDRNAGVLAAFERSLRLANGEIIFLSDHDDVWLPGKVDKALSVFTADPTVTMVATDAMLINAQGGTINNSFLSMRGGFAPGVLRNFIRNKYVGCTLSFRRTMLRYFLPIPRDVPMHDMWFGMLNQIYGQTFYIDEPLTAYRRHGRNTSPMSRAHFAKMTLWRYRLAKNLLLRVMTGGKA
jgi:glycosyltransferase involved in cell wall biosynthesis